MSREESFAGAESERFNQDQIGLSETDITAVDGAACMRRTSQHWLTKNRRRSF